MGGSETEDIAIADLVQTNRCKKSIRSEVVKMTVFLVALKIKSNNMETTTTPRIYPRSGGGE